MRRNHQFSAVARAALSVVLTGFISPSLAQTAGPSPPGGPGATAAAAAPFTTSGPGMVAGNQTFPNGAGPIYEFQPFPTPAGFSCEVTTANNGDLISDEFTGNKMGRVSPHTGQVSEIPLDNAVGFPGGQNRGPDGDIWFGEVGGNGLGRLNPETNTITTYAFPWDNVTVTAGLPIPAAINTGPGISFDTSWAKDGNIYFTMIGLNAIGSFNPSTGEWLKYDIPTPLAGPVAMEDGPNDTIAITEGTANKVALFNIYTKQFTEYAIPTTLPGGGTTFPAGLSVSADHRYLYFGETLASKVGRLDSTTGQIFEYDLLALRNNGIGGGVTGGVNGNPLPQPGQMRFGSDGMLYIVNGTFTGGGTIGQLDVNKVVYNEIATPTPLSMPCDLQNTIPGVIAFANFRTNKVSYFQIPNTVDVSGTYPLHY